MSIKITTADSRLTCFFWNAISISKAISKKSIFRYHGCRCLLLGVAVLVVSLTSISSYASDVAWVFAQRTNTVLSLRDASHHHGVNAAEIDITLRARIKDKNKRKACSEIWCAFQKSVGSSPADKQASNLSLILENLALTLSLHAVWLDVKTLNASPKDYRILFDTVRKTLSDRGRGREPRKFWGVYPGNATNSPYVKTLIKELPKIGKKSENLLILDVKNSNEARQADKFCRQKRIQCGVSSGHSFKGGSAASNEKKITAINGSLDLKNINSVFLSTFDWSGHSEADMMRLLFRDRSYREKLAGVKRYCGQEGNGVIVGPRTKIYSRNFCDSNNSPDACSYAKEEIMNGPNRLGKRSSDISRPRGYSNSNC